jgi:hypothetical protein
MKLYFRFVIKQLTLLALAFLLGNSAFSQNGNAGLGTNNPHPSAKFEIAADSQGFLMPRLSTLQRLDVSNPANGLMVYDIDTNSPWFFNGTVWQNTVVPQIEVPSSVIFSFMSQSGTAQAAETTIGSYVIPASAIESDGQAIELHAFGEVNTDTGIFRFKFAAQVLTFPVFAAGRWDARITLHRLPGGSTKISGALVMPGYQTSAFSTGLLNFDAAIPFQITAQQNDPLINGLTVEGFFLSRVR